MDASMTDKDSCAWWWGAVFLNWQERLVDIWNTNLPNPFYAILFLCAGGILPIQNRFMKFDFYQ
jgi:hypothetical protein